MTTLSSSAVHVCDGEITVDAEVLAPRLGVTVEALKKHMANGRVTSVSETGINEDAGRTRLTFRFGTRVWRLVIEPDGTLIEDPPRVAKPRSQPDTTNPFIRPLDAS